LPENKNLLFIYSGCIETPPTF